MTGTSLEAHLRCHCFYDRIDPPDEARLCPELQTALAAIRSVEPASVLVMGEAEPKSPRFVCVLERTPGAPALDAVRASALAGVNVHEDGIACTTHWAELSWGEPPPLPPALGEPGPFAMALFWMLILAVPGFVLWRLLF